MPEQLREYATARKHNKPRLVFLKDCERTPSAQAFVEKISNEVTWKRFAEPQKLETLIQLSLVELVRQAVKRLSEKELAVLAVFLEELRRIESAVTSQTTEPETPAPHIQVLEPERPRSETPDLPRIKIGKDGKRVILIPAGEFLRGTSDADMLEMNLRFGWYTKLFDNEKPQRKIYLDAYYIDETLVTNAEYKRFLDANPFHKVPRGWDENWRMFPPGKDNHPVGNVTWDDANAYVRWAGKRLPTEAQWEKAARGTDGRRYPWGNEQPDWSRCNFHDDEKGTTPVGKYSPRGDSPYGVKDMAGNAWEWVADWYDTNYYKNSPLRNPKNETPGQYAYLVMRGGSWGNRAGEVRAAYRSITNPDEFPLDSGFRCVE